MAETKQLEKQMIRQAEERILKGFLEWIILKRLVTRPQGGYDIIQYVLKRYHILVTSGTVYSKLYAMEREGLIQSTMGSKRTYNLTIKGLKMIGILCYSQNLKRFINNVVNADPEVQVPEALATLN